MAEEIYMSIKSDVKSATKDTQEYTKSLKDAQNNVKEVNESLSIQNRVIIDLEKELLRLKQIQDSIPKGAFFAGQAKLNEDIRNVTAELKREKLGLKDLKQQQKEATAEVKEFNTANKETVKTLGDQIADFKVFGVSLNGIKKGFAGIIPVAKASFATIKAGLISTGIGAFVVAFGTLITYLTQTKRGAEALQRGLTGLSAGIKVVVDRISGLVDGVGLLFSGDFSAGLTKLKDQFTGIGDEIVRETTVAVALKKSLQDLVDRERDLNVEFAQRRAEIEKLKLKSEDLTLSDKERLKALEDANEIEEKLNAKKVANAEENVRILKAQKGQGENLQKDLEQIAEAEIKLANIRRESARRQQTVEARANTIRRKTERENEAKRKEAEDKRIADEKRRADAQAKTIEDFNKLLEDNRINSIKDEEERERALIERQNERRLNQIHETVNDEKEKNRLLLLNKELFEEENDAITQKFREKFEQEEEEDAKNEIRRKKIVRDQSVALARSGLRLVSEIAGEGSKIGKAVAIADATISGIQGVQNAFSTAQKSPVTAVFPAYPTIQAGLAAAFSALQIQKIVSTDPSGSGGSGGVGNVGGGGSAGGGRGIPNGNALGGTFELTGGQEPEPLKAFVVTDEMTSSQNQLANIRRRSTI